MVLLIIDIHWHKQWHTLETKDGIYWSQVCYSFTYERSEVTWHLGSQFISNHLHHQILNYQFHWLLKDCNNKKPAWNVHRINGLNSRLIVYFFELNKIVKTLYSDHPHACDGMVRLSTAYKKIASIFRLFWTLERRMSKHIRLHFISRCRYLWWRHPQRSVRRYLKQFASILNTSFLA